MIPETNPSHTTKQGIHQPEQKKILIMAFLILNLEKQGPHFMKVILENRSHCLFKQQLQMTTCNLSIKAKVSSAQ